MFNCLSDQTVKKAIPNPDSVHHIFVEHDQMR